MDDSERLITARMVMVVLLSSDQAFKERLPDPTTVALRVMDYILALEAELEKKSKTKNGMS